MHLGHQKALLKCRAHPTGQDAGTSYFKALSIFMNLATTTGTPPERWSVITTTVIEKAKGDNRIHRQRMIQMPASDANLLLGLLWGRRLIFQANDAGLLHQEQWG